MTRTPAGKNLKSDLLSAATYALGLGPRAAQPPLHPQLRNRRRRLRPARPQEDVRVRDLRHAAPLGNVLKTAALGVAHVQEGAHLVLTKAGGFGPGLGGRRQMCRGPGGSGVTLECEGEPPRANCARRTTRRGRSAAAAGPVDCRAKGRRVRPALSTCVAKAEGSRSVPPGTSAGSYHITQCSMPASAW